MNASIGRMKIESLLDAPLVDLVAGIVEAAGAGGYTMLPALGGSERNGRWREDRASGADTKLRLPVIATEQIAETSGRGLEPLLDSYSLIVMTTQIGVVRSEKAWLIQGMPLLASEASFALRCPASAWPLRDRKETGNPWAKRWIRRH